MTNKHVGILTALLVASSTCLDPARDAAFAGESQPVPLWSRAVTSPEQEWPSLRPAAKVQADACPSVDVAALTGDALIDYLRTTSEGCLRRTLHISANPSIRADVPTIFSNQNMQSVFAKIEELTAAYDGTNSSGMLHLWFFVQVGYSYYRFFPGETGVGPFNEATDRAYLAASDAFAASDHFYAPNDEAAQILYYYFESAFAAGLRQNHLAPIKQVLSGLTPERAVSGDHVWAPQSWVFITVLRRVHGAFLNDSEEFINAIAQDPEFVDIRPLAAANWGAETVASLLVQDPEFVDVMLQVTRYDFFFLIEEDHPFTPRLRLLETTIQILVRLTQLDSLREAAIAALISVLSEHERLSSPFLVAARGLENQADCASLNICRDVLESEILARALPNTYRFDDGAIAFETPLDLEEVLPWYYAAKEVQAQFHRLVETDEVVRDDIDAFTARIYGTNLDHTVFEKYLSGADTRGIYVYGIYRDGTMSTFVRNRLGDRVTYSGGSFEEVVRRGYANYLADRFGLLTSNSWFDISLAEFLVSSTQAEGVPVRESQVQYIASDQFRLDPAGLFYSYYSGGLGGTRSHYYAALFFHFMHQQRRGELLELFDLVRSGDRAAYNALIATWAADSQLAADFDAFLDEQIANLDQLTNPPTSYIHPSFLTSDSAAEVESALQRINDDLNLDCRTVATEPSPRFGCSGSLPAESLSSGDQGEPSLFDLLAASQIVQFVGDRGAINEHLNTRLDSFIVAAVEDGAIANFEAMNCYFTNVAGSPPAADLYCEGPLRPADVASAQVDLKATLSNLNGGSSAYVGERLRLRAALDFRGKVASNVTMTWSASLPVASPTAVGPCEVVEKTERTGTLACGVVYNENAGSPLTLSLYLTPWQVGVLDFSVEFSSDGPEVEPADNVASLQLTISRESSHIATLLGHSLSVASVAFSPDGTTLASGALDGTVKLWDVATKTNTATLSWDTDRVYSVAFSPDGTTLAVGLEDGTIQLWDVATKTNTATLEGGFIVHSVAFSPDGTTLAAGLEDGSVKLWDVATKTNTATLSWDTDRVYSVAFSPDGTTLAAGLGNSFSESNHAVVKLWNVATKNISTLSGHEQYITSVAFSPDGTTVAGAGAGSDVRLWNVATETSITLDVRWRVGSVAFSPDGATLAVGTGDNGTIQLWDVATKTNIATFSGHASLVYSVAFSPDGNILASGSGDKTVQLWDVSEWKRAKRLVLAEERIGQPDSPQLAQNAPNPFNSQTVLSYFLHSPGPARLEVFALTGQRVAVLRQGPQQAGYHRLYWDARDEEGRPLASGLYLYRLVTAEGALTRKLMLLR